MDRAVENRRLQRKLFRVVEKALRPHRNGTRLGRPPALDAETIAEAYERYYRKGYPCRYIAFLLGVSRITLERAFHREGLSYPA